MKSLIFKSRGRLTEKAGINENKRQPPKSKKPENTQFTGFLVLLELIPAEREGFEPPEVLPSTVFETATFNRSATSPGAQLERNEGQN